MGIYVKYIVVLLILCCGCIHNDDDQFERNYPVCTCKTERPYFYVINLEFKRHDGELCVFPWKVYAADYKNEGFELVPSYIYETKVVDINKTIYYYSVELPVKNEAGFLVVHCINQPCQYLIDYDSVRATAIPVKHLPLDENAKEVKKQMRKYLQERLQCEYHRRFTRDY